MAKRKNNRFDTHKTNSYSRFSSDYPEGDVDANGRYTKVKRKEKILRAVGVTAGFSLLFVTVYFFATLMFDISNLPIEKPEASAPPAQSSGEPSQTESPEKEDEPVRAVWLTALPFADKEGAGAFAEKAKANGINSIVFEMKREDGTLAFNSSNELASEIGASKKTQANLNELLAALRESGINVIAAVNCFNDPLMSLEKRETAVHYKGTDGLWFDNKPEAGGKSWLNPYSDEAKEYLYAILDETAAFPVDEILLLGVQFPSGYSQELSEFKGEAEGPSRNNVLLQFINTAKQRLGGTPLIVSMTGGGAINGDEKLYNGNIIGSEADKAAPDLRLSRTVNVKIGDEMFYVPSDKPEEFMTAAAPRLASRAKIGSREIALSPIIDYPMPQGVRNLTEILSESGIEGYILYNPQNSYF